MTTICEMTSELHAETIEEEMDVREDLVTLRASLSNQKSHLSINDNYVDWKLKTRTKNPN